MYPERHLDEVEAQEQGQTGKNGWKARARRGMMAGSEDSTRVRPAALMGATGSGGVTADRCEHVEKDVAVRSAKDGVWSRSI